MSKSSTFFFLILALLASCDPEVENGGGTSFMPISDKLHPLLFDTGSCWIYNNQVDSRLDTVNLTARKIDTLYVNTGSGYTNLVEVYVLDYLSSIYGHYSNTYKGSVILGGENSGPLIYLASFKVGQEDSNARIANIHDSLIINGIRYDQVVEMEIFQSGSTSELGQRLFFSDSIGIVRKILFNGSNDSIAWELMNYEVELEY